MKIFFILFFAVRLGSTTEVCLQGWTYYKKSCYKLFLEKRSWEQARLYCRMFKGGDLIHFFKPTEQVHIGNTDNDRIIWTGLKYDNSTWSWTDDRTTVTDHPSIENPNVTGSALCGAFNGSSWTGKNCDELSAYLCQSGTTACLGPTWLTTPGHHCINIVNSSHGQTWTASREYCRVRNGDLAIFYHSSDIEFLKNLSLSSHYWWLGLKYDLNSNAFIWLDGKPVSDNTTFIEYLTQDPDLPACGGLMGNKTKSMNITLFNSQCSNTLKFICELASCASNPGVFACSEDTCIEKSKVCDGNMDCNNGADETISRCGLQVTTAIAATTVRGVTYHSHSTPNATTDNHHTSVTSNHKETTERTDMSTYDKEFAMMKTCILEVGSHVKKECIRRFVNATADYWSYDTLTQLFNFGDTNDTTNMLKTFISFLDVAIEKQNQTNKFRNPNTKSMMVDIDKFVQTVYAIKKFAKEIEISQDNVELLVTEFHLIHQQDFRYTFKIYGGNLSHVSLDDRSEIPAEDDIVTALVILLVTKEKTEKIQLSETKTDGFIDGDVYRISPILSLNVFKNKMKMSVSHTYSLYHDLEVLKIIETNGSIKTDIMCGFIDNTKSAWSAKGCSVLYTDEQFTTCRCNHTTNFAVLMQVTSIKLKDVHEFALNIITYVGCSVSLITQLITITVFTCVGSLNSERVYVHRNLCFAIVAAQVSFLAGIKAVQNKILCACVALILHYFYTSVFVWMLVEGLHLYSKVVQVFGTEKSRAIYYFGFGWGVPLVLVTISASADWDGYGTRKSCWLSTKKGTIWAFVGPALAVIVVNVVILWMVVRIVMSSAKHERNGEFDHIRAGVKGALFLLPLLGLTWAFGLLAVNEDLIIFQYLFAVFNSLQVRQALRRMKEKRVLQRGDFNSSSNGSGMRSQSWKTKPIRLQKKKRIPYRSTQSKESNSTPPTSSTQINSRGSIDSGRQGCQNHDVTVQDLTKEEENIDLTHI